MNDTTLRSRLRFGVFEVDPVSGEVWKQGIEVRLHDKPFQVLRALLEHPGQVVARKELQERLWPGDTVVEFENGLNNAMSRLRETLGDSADSPRFIETIPRRGYRFIAPVEPVGDSKPPAGGHAPSPPASPGWTSRWRAPALFATIALVALGTGLYLYFRVLGGPLHAIDSVAVLPFVTASGSNGSDEYMAFGMTEALIAELSRVGELKVISQTSILRYKDTRKPLTEIARELGVGAIVEGSVVHEGSQVRITVQLIDAGSDTHLWAETYRQPPETVLAAQGDLARSIARELRARLTGQPAPPEEAPAPVNPRAHEAYLKGRYFLQRRGEENLARARTYFEQALEADPRHARALAGLSDFYTLTDSMPPAAAFPRAKTYARAAVEVEESLAAGHVALGYVYYYGDWDWPAAEREFRRAIEIDGGDSRAHYRYARLLATLGRAEEARGHMERALLLDPLSITVHDTAAWVWFNTRDYARMIDQAGRILELEPRDHRAYEHLAVAHLLSGELDEALAAAEQGSQALPGEPLFGLLSGIVHHRLGHADESAMLLGSLEAASRASYVPEVFLAIAAAQVGRTEAALASLEKAYASHDPYMVLLNVNPWFDPVREHPRFQSLVRAMRFPPREPG